MSKLEELRQHGGSFPGALVNVLEEFEARLKALEAHAPMLDTLAPEYQRELQRRAEAERVSAEPPAETPATTAEGMQFE